MIDHGKTVFGHVLSNGTMVWPVDHGQISHGLSLSVVRTSGGAHDNSWLLTMVDYELPWLIMNYHVQP